MQVDGIISNTITEDIRLKGHQSIRFASDGFSVLISDASYRPVFLKQFSFDSDIQKDQLPSECGRILEEYQLLSFEGETVLILDSLAVTVIPKQFFDESQNRALLDKACNLADTDQVYHRFIKARKFFLIYAVAKEIEALKEWITGDVKVIHSSECLLSLADQVKSSDHQRGVIVADVQPFSLDILFVQEDHIKLINKYALKDSSDFIYHALNTMNQLGIDRESIPIYLSGIIHEEHELFGLLGKYIRRVSNTPYYLEELTKVQMIRFMVLSEGSKCA
jgi:hypothetical protein